MFEGYFLYLAQKLNIFFQNMEFCPGEAYFIQLDDREYINALFQKLGELGNSQPFIMHFANNDVESIEMVYQGNGIIVATSNGMTDGNLVYLRNAIKEQNGVFKGKSIVFIINNYDLDSITNDGANLIDKGMPFNPNEISEGLYAALDNSRLDATDKEIIKFNISKYKEIRDDEHSLFENAESLALIIKGHIDDTDYNRLGLFRDENLSEYLSNAQDRLEDNFRLFEYIKQAHDQNLVEEQLTKKFDEDGVRKLSKDKWKELDYKVVRQSYDNNKKNKKIILEGIFIDTQYFYDKTQSDTAAGKRKHNILIFNPDNSDIIHLELCFDNDAPKDFLSYTGNLSSTCKGKKIAIDLACKENDVSYYVIKYAYEKQATSTFLFEICVVPFEEAFLKIKNIYKVDAKKHVLGFISSGINDIHIGNPLMSEQVNAVSDGDIVSLNDMNLCLSSDFINALDEAVAFKIVYGECEIKCIINNEGVKPVPIKISQIEKLKRQYGESFELYEKTISIGGRVYYYGANGQAETDLSNVNDRIMLEKQLIHEEILFGEINDNKSIAKDMIMLPSSVREAYIKVLHFYKDNDTCPLLCHFDDTQAMLYRNLVDVFCDVINEIGNDVLGEDQKNLLLLGMLKKGDTFYASPFNIVNVVYRLALYLETGDEELSIAILNRLDASSLVPYLYMPFNDALFRSCVCEGGGYWTKYVNNTSVASTMADRYLSDLVSEKLKQFRKYYSLLFGFEKAPLLINAINLADNKEFLKGILNFEKGMIEAYGDSLPVQITYYQDDCDKSITIERFFMTDSISTIDEQYDSLLKQYDIEDARRVLEQIRESISYFIMPETSDSTEYKYAHITFCNSNSLDAPATHTTEDIQTGLMLNGIVESISSVLSSDFRLGFGKKGLSSDVLINRVAVLLNEYACNMINGARNTYERGKSIVSVSSLIKQEQLEKMYDSSYWVTFIDPKFTLDYFLKKSDELLIVHYGDQLESSNTYTAITVTKKTDIYKSIMCQYLEDNGVPVNSENIENAIKIFNSINGEWLLKLIETGNRYSSRANISHISAVKYMRAYLHHRDIVWIPISMEEILRVAGTMRLSSETIFSSKELGLEGAASDDILLIGVTKTEPLQVFFYPVEVKVSKNDSVSINKGKRQIKNISEVYEKKLYPLEEDSFVNKFYRNYFMQLMLTNIDKLNANGLFEADDYRYIDAVRNKLLNDDFSVSIELVSLIGHGAVICFKPDTAWKSADIQDGILVLELKKEDAYTGVVEEERLITQKIQEGRTDLNTKNLISKVFKLSERSEETTETEVEAPQVDVEENYIEAAVDNISKDDESLVINEKTANVQSTENGHVEKGVQSSSNKLEKVKVLIGTIGRSDRKVYWEYGNSLLSNRHLLILGKSGQGKSYLIQCLLLELSYHGISSLIIDYTDGFKKSQLEKPFKEYLGEKLQQFVVAKDKFPLNPFKANRKEIDEDEFIDEDASDIADRVQSILDSIYGFGPQQSNCIYQAVKQGINLYGSNMTLAHLREILEEDDSPNAKTALSRMALLFDKDPFSYDGEFDWGVVEKTGGMVYIIQLTGFMKDIQKVITEFVLWDLWYHRVQVGNKNSPITMVLDEAQNLNHNDKSPSAKILTEGRKFGWSAWYATQFLKGAFDADEVKRLENSGQKVFFMPPDSEMTQVAAMLSKDVNDRKEWESKLASLKKGQCVSYGLMVDNNGIARGDIATIVNITSLEDRVQRFAEQDS